MEGGASFSTQDKWGLGLELKEVGLWEVRARLVQCKEGRRLDGRARARRRARGGKGGGGGGRREIGLRRGRG